jgi:hypothetical protein
MAIDNAFRNPPIVASAAREAFRSGPVGRIGAPCRLRNLRDPIRKMAAGSLPPAASVWGRNTTFLSGDLPDENSEFPGS